MKFSKTTKRVLSLAMTAAVAASFVAVAPAPKQADAAGSYKAYLCFATKGYKGVRSNHDDGEFKLGVHNGNDKKKISAKCTDATFKKGKVSFTVSVTGNALKKALKGDKGFNTIYVDTSLPGTSKKKFTVSKAVLKIDGKTVKTISKPYLTPDAGKEKSENTQIMIINTWNPNAEKKFKSSSLTKVPTKSMAVTVTGTLK